AQTGATGPRHASAYRRVRCDTLRPSMSPAIGVRLWSSVLLCAALPSASADLALLPDYLRMDPFGALIEAGPQQMQIETARAGYVSRQIVAKVPEAGEYQLEVGQFSPRSGITVELYREWFHFVPQTKRLYPDALIPVP